MSQPNEIIQLNIGGTYFSTTYETLTSIEENSLFSDMFKTKSVPIIKDADNKVFLDRDGTLFKHILGYLRNKNLTLSENFGDLKLLKDEAEYYKLPKLLKIIENDYSAKATQSLNALALVNKRPSYNNILSPTNLKSSSGCIVVGYRGLY
jgi:hypothetical protein